MAMNSGASIVALVALAGRSLVARCECVFAGPDHGVVTVPILVKSASQTHDLEVMRGHVQKPAKRECNLRHVTVQLEFLADGCHDEALHFDHRQRLGRD